MPSKSVDLKASYSNYPFTLKVSFSESKENIENNTTQISISASLNASQASYSGSNSKLAIYWYDNNTGKSKLVKEATFNSCGMSYGSKSVSGSITVKHNEDGSLRGYAQVKFTASQTLYTPPNTTLRTDTTTLKTIPQSATISEVKATELGKQVTVSIDRKSTSFIHKVDYYFEDENDKISVTVDAKDSVSFTPGIELASHLTNGVTGKLTVRVGTYKSDGKIRVGSIQSKTVNCKIPSSVVPTMDAPTAALLKTNIPQSWNIFVQGYSGVQIRINNAKGIYGSTIKSYRITGSGINAASSTASCDVLKESGKLSYFCEATDSRGRKVTKSVEIDVLPYRPPSATIKAERSLINGEPAINGTSLLVTADYSIDTLNGNNHIKSKSVSCNLTSTSTFESSIPFVLDCNASIGSTYQLLFELTDELNRSVELSIEVPSSKRIWNCKDDRLCVGGFAERPGFTSKWSSYFEGDVYFKNKKFEYYDWTNVEYATGFKTHSDNPVQVKRQDDVVMIRGVCTNIAAETFSIKKMFTLPPWARPIDCNINILEQGSGSNRFLLLINTNGDVSIDRYSNNSAMRNETPANSWLNCFATFMI